MGVFLDIKKFRVLLLSSFFAPNILRGCGNLRFGVVEQFVEQISAHNCVSLRFVPNIRDIVKEVIVTIFVIFFDFILNLIYELSLLSWSYYKIMLILFIK